MDCRADGDPQLVGVHHAGELPSGLLPVRSQHQEIPILCEYDATEVRHSLQEELVVTIGRAVRFRGQHVDALLPYADRNPSWHVVIEVQPEAH